MHYYYKKTTTKKTLIRTEDLKFSLVFILQYATTLHHPASHYVGPKWLTRRLMYNPDNLFEMAFVLALERVISHIQCSQVSICSL